MFSEQGCLFPDTNIVKGVLCTVETWLVGGTRPSVDRLTAVFTSCLLAGSFLCRALGDWCASGNMIVVHEHDR